MGLYLKDIWTHTEIKSESLKKNYSEEKRTFKNKNPKIFHLLFILLYFVREKRMIQLLLYKTKAARAGKAFSSIFKIYF